MSLGKGIECCHFVSIGFLGGTPNMKARKVIEQRDEQLDPLLKQMQLT